jgi:aryl-alcohol dehydrogenase-like predicted oxidoreductase
MDHRVIGRTGLSVTPIGFGAFKIGRNVGSKYESAYELPSEDEAAALLNGVLDLGINYIDTAPAYGLSEERIGAALAQRRDEFVISTKVGERFVGGASTFDFSRAAIEESIGRSRKRLRTDVLDIVFIHSDGRDLEILSATDAVATLVDLRERGVIRAVGFSGKTVEGAIAASAVCDALMVEYHMEDTSHAELLRDWAHRGIGVVVKKGLASGRLRAEDAIPFVLQVPAVASMVIGGLNLEHIRANVRIAEAMLRKT